MRGKCVVRIVTNAVGASFVSTGLTPCAGPNTQEGPSIGLMFCCHHLKTLNRFMFKPAEVPSDHGAWEQMRYRQHSRLLLFLDAWLPGGFTRPMSTELRWAHCAWGFAELQIKYKASSLHGRFSWGAVSPGRCPFPPKLTSNAQRRCL